jgi:hypothetical protein
VKLLLRLCAVVMVVVSATWAYRVNYATQEAMNRVADLEAAISAEREALAVLDAEWAYLNRPDRLRRSGSSSSLPIISARWRWSPTRPSPRYPRRWPMPGSGRRTGRMRRARTRRARTRRR